MQSSPDTQGAGRQSFWLSIVRIFILELALLLAVSGALVAYLNWSSDVNVAEFMAPGTTPANPALHATKVHAPRCDRGA